MNPNFDFRSDSIWDDRAINESVGDALPSQKALGWSAAIVTFFVALMVIS
jgi:hypothetical protein